MGKGFPKKKAAFSPFELIARDHESRTDARTVAVYFPDRVTYAKEAKRNLKEIEKLFPRLGEGTLLIY